MGRRETGGRDQDWRSALPRDGAGRVLFGVGFAALLAGVPLMWMWLRYLSELPEWGIYAGTFALCAFVLALGRGLIGMIEA